MGRIRPLRERLRRMLQPEHLKRETERMAQDAAFNSFLMNLIAPVWTASDASDLTPQVLRTIYDLFTLIQWEGREMRKIEHEGQCGTNRQREEEPRTRCSAPLPPSLRAPSALPTRGA